MSKEFNHNNAFKYWDFIEKYHPYYYSCDDVLLSEILNQKLQGKEISSSDEEYIEGWNIKEELLKINTELLIRALENYFEKNFQIS